MGHSRTGLCFPPLASGTLAFSPLHGLQESSPLPLLFPHFYFQLSLAIYSYVRQLRQAESGLGRPHAKGATTPAWAATWPAGSQVCTLGGVDRPLAGAQMQQRSQGSTGAGLEEVAPNSRRGWGGEPTFPSAPRTTRWAALRKGPCCSGLISGICKEPGRRLPWGCTGLPTVASASSLWNEGPSQKPQSALVLSNFREPLSTHPFPA